jgi:hypothetical protein
MFIAFTLPAAFVVCIAGRELVGLDGGGGAFEIVPEA